MAISPLLNRRIALTGLLSLPLAACETIDPVIFEGILNGGPLSQAEAASGIRAALDNGIVSAIDTVSSHGGFLNNNLIRIPLPQKLQDVQSLLAKVGASSLLDQLEVQLNRGAEAAAPIAKDIFFGAVRELTIADAIGIVRGPENAATAYLQSKTTTKLASLFTPIMENALGDTGALRLLDQISAQVRNIPFAEQIGADARVDLIGHGVDHALGGVFHFIGKEEAAIRADPAKRTSEILRRVFGGRTI